MSVAQPSGKQTEARVSTPKNIIMVVADGMGPAYTTAYRNFMDDPSTPQVETVVFDDILTGNASTYPHHVSGYVTDSAASATALASGAKSYNGAIGVDHNKVRVESVLQLAKKQGMRTGVAVTSQINHATPASYIAHNESRKNYNALADSFFDDRINGEIVADVMLGGGTQYFERDDRDLVAEFIDADYQYVDSYNKLATIPAGSDVLGLFAPVGLPPALDDKRAHRLSYLTEHAIKHLENPEGFFLLVEASQVDWAGHANDIGSAMAEMDDLAATISYLKTYVKNNPDTLVVLTADHSTGGLTIGAKGDYRWAPEFLKDMKSSVSTVARNIPDMDQPLAYISQQFGFAFTEDDHNMLNKVLEQDKAADREVTLKKFLDMKSNTGWTTSGHTGVDVEVFSFGAGSHAFVGQMDNTDIAHRMKAFVTESTGNMKTTDTPVAMPAEDDCDFHEDFHCE
nr:alkaline phosphatase [Salinimonas chungwhensis]